MSGNPIPPAELERRLRLRQAQVRADMVRHYVLGFDATQLECCADKWESWAAQVRAYVKTNVTLN